MTDLLEVVDSHFHVWDLAQQHLPWLAETSGAISRTYTMQDVRAAHEAAGVSLMGSVYVEVDCADPIDEDMRALSLVDKAPIRHVLRAHLSSTMRVPLRAVGVREPLHVPSSPLGRMREPEFLDGLVLLGESQLIFDACIRPGVEALQDLLEAARHAQQTTIVLDHCANLVSVNEAETQLLYELGQCDNVVLKVSGFPTTDRPRVYELLSLIKEAFPTHRRMYASNFPVIDLYGSLRDHVEILRDTFEDDPQFFALNAQRVYYVNSTTR